jgi:ribonuclease P protein component
MEVIYLFREIFMKKKFVLKNNQDFRRLINNKNYVLNNSFALYYQKNDLDHARFGISVSKKHGNAVVRNKLKRQIRMMIDDTFQFSKSCDYLIMIRKDYQKRDYAQNLEELKKLDKKIQKRGEI